MNKRRDHLQSLAGRRKKKTSKIKVLRHVLVLLLTCALFLGAGKVLGGVAQAVTNNNTVSSAQQFLIVSKQNEQVEKPKSKVSEKVDKTPVMPNTLNGSNVKKSEWNLILINPWNKLPEGFSVERTTLKNGHSIDKRAYPDLQEMMDAARAEGLSPVICSSFRKLQKQQTLYTNQVNKYISRGYSKVDAEKEAAKWVAVPGTSEHQTGLAVDIVALSYQLLDKVQENTAEQKWFMKNSYKYGFILRYPSEKSHITGIGYEPWHYRYVGKEAAKEIYEKGICLEEYLES